MRNSSQSTISNIPPVGIEAVRLAVKNFICHYSFDYAMGLVIMFNMFLIIVETDHAAENDDGIPVVESIGWTILVIFIVELALRLFVYGSNFFFDGWNNFDFFVVVTDLFFSILGMILGSVFPVSTLRVLRLCKLARVSKVFRVFPELRIMMAGLIGSFRAIFWGSVLLTFVLLVWAIIAVQFIHPLNKEISDIHARNNCERCPRAYSSVLQASLTFAQQIVAGDSWGTATLPVIEAYPWTALYFAGVFLTVAVAVMNLILGVVVNVAAGEHERLQGELADKASIEKMMASDDILKICEDIDEDDSGELSAEELQGLKESPEFRLAIEHMNINKADLAMAFETIDADKSGSTSYVELITMLHKMSDSSVEFMLEQIKYHIVTMKELFVEHAAVAEPNVNNVAQPSDNKEEVGSGTQAKEVKLLGVDTATQVVGLELRLAVDTATQVVRCGGDDDSRENSRGIGEKGVEVKYLGSPELHSDSGNHHLSEEVLHALLKVSSCFQDDFKDSLKHLESRLEVHASTTSKLISQIAAPQTPGDDLMSILRMPASSCDNMLAPRARSWI